VNLPGILPTTYKGKRSPMIEKAFLSGQSGTTKLAWEASRGKETRRRIYFLRKHKNLGQDLLDLCPSQRS
jgi:hypothetical protein